MTLFALEGVVPGDELLLFAVFGETAAAPVPDAPRRPPRDLQFWVLVSILLSVLLTVLLNLLLLF